MNVLAVAVALRMVGTMSGAIYVQYFSQVNVKHYTDAGTSYQNAIGRGRSILHVAKHAAWQICTRVKRGGFLSLLTFPVCGEVVDQGCACLPETNLDIYTM